ncbi:hypothetical protein DYL61_16945 [Pseudomonas nabeulensis]|uniref:Receptor protein-tyrosine kinase n=2 Tax=Pseudomonas TaxID=286 RepID=A0A4Z0B1G9_9PSED|nr:MULTISPECIES: hypothetical protein [Pseudomonas]MQT88116.1 hypothetical protein [Pseudomonas helleri]TFY92912.1 hypothetical protein DYL61_16945 [Pseudomonas nabeulensis]
MHKDPPVSKVFYRPIEAAIRWAGLLRYKQDILSAISSPRELPLTLECPRWDELRLCTDRIYDAIINQELSYGRNGITLNDEALLESDDLTVRHVDLKRWMRMHYPEHRPAFLFSRSERIAHPVITLETGQALLVERQALKADLMQCRRQMQELQERYDGLLKQSTVIPACNQCPISDRAETTYLNIIGGMLELMLSQSPSGVPYSSFRTQEAIVSAMVANHGGAMGITERTLNGKFASAKRNLRNAM